MERTCRRVNGFFLSIIILNLGASVAVSMLDAGGVKMGTMVTLLFTQLLILVPSLVFLLIFRCDISEWVPFKKLRPGTVALVVLFSFLVMPFISLINVVSQLFTENEVMGMSESFLEIPSVIIIAIVGFIGPFCEEFTFRGIMFGGLRKSGYVFAAAVVSSLYFGLMHLNLNQMCYALVMGVIFSMLVEATGSIWGSVLCHAVINTWNMLKLLVMDKIYADLGQDLMDLAQETIDMDMKVSMIGFLVGVSAVTTLIAAGVYIAIFEHEGRKEYVRSMFYRPEGEDDGNRRLITPSGCIAMAICIIVIFFLDKILALLKSANII